MRLLLLHSDYIDVEAKEKAVKNAEEIEKRELHEDEVLVVFTAFEEGDNEKMLEKARDAIIEVLKQVNCEKVFLYPYVHLTSKPALSSQAKELLLKLEDLLAKEVEVSHAPFGWYKSFAIKVKGHPLSELSREIRGEKELVSKSLKAEEKLKSEFFILTPKGELIPVSEFDFTAFPNLKKLVDYETKKVRAYESEPVHIKLMLEHQLVDYEPGSDAGNFRFYPKGRLIKKILEEEVTKYCLDYGAFEVETPIMYDFQHPALEKYLNRFPARQYIVLSDRKKLFLRFAACFGQFLIMHTSIISYKDLPFKLYELTRYSFRREQSGELAGLKRLRAFTMPDMHTLVKDLDEAKKEFFEQFKICKKWNKNLGIETEVAVRVVKDFFEKNRDFYVNIAKEWGKPIMLEIFEERYAYFITKFEMNFIDSKDKASALSTVQIDVENAETFDISYVDEDGKKKRPLILHASISGSIERVIYALLEKEGMKIRRGEKAMLPVWLSPIQLRLIPINDEALKYIKKEILPKLSGRKVRFDVDDRNLTLSKKVMEAEKEWIPYIAIVGKKEIESGKLSVTVRKSDEKKEMDISALIDEIEGELGGHVFKEQTFPIYLSKMPVFGGRTR